MGRKESNQTNQLCMLGNFPYVLLSAGFFSKSLSSKKIFQEYQSVNILSCLIWVQRLSADDTSKQRVKEEFRKVNFIEDLTRVLLYY